MLVAALLGVSCISAAGSSETSALLPLGPTPGDASRFLSQATFGATLEDIETVRREGYGRWIRRQMVLEWTSHRAWFREHATSEDAGGRATRQNGWWTIAVTGEDQLRQRVAFALSQLFVVSESDRALENSEDGLSAYYDILVEHAFGRYRDLLEAVTLSPAMGHYLSMMGNPRPDPVRRIRSDENFAREVLQLFSIGLVELGIDGMPRRDAEGRTIPTYSQDEIEGLARALTGWTSNGASSFRPLAPDFSTPMTVFRAVPGAGPGDFHDTGEKTIVRGVRLPGGQTAERDLQAVLDTIATHPNVAPFVSRHLIQRLTTSNPTRGYVRRVATVFRLTGGDLGATVRAILMDREARLGDAVAGASFGKVREPVLRLTHLWRAFRGRPSAKSGLATFDVRSIDTWLGQAPYRAPSVFSWFGPDFAPAFAARGLDASPGLVAPELQPVDESSVARTDNFFAETARHHDGPNAAPNDYVHNVRLSIARESVLAHDPDALLDEFDVLLLGGRMSAGMRDALRDHITSLPADRPDVRVQQAIHLVFASPQYQVER